MLGLRALWQWWWRRGCVPTLEAAVARQRQSMEGALTQLEQEMTAACEELVEHKARQRGLEE